MKRLLRGVIATQKIPASELDSNFMKLRKASVEWLQAPDRRVFRFITDFYARQAEVPSAAVLLDFFSKTDDPEVVDRLREVLEATPHVGADYTYVLDAILEDARKEKFKAALKTASKIAHSGETFGEGKEKKRLEGVDAAIDYFFDQARGELRRPGKNDRHTEGELIFDPRETGEAWAEYRAAEEVQPLGVLSGLVPIDAVTKGLKQKQLWLHAAFTGGLKSTFAVNWAVRCALRYHRGCLFYSLEMPKEEIRQLAYCLHGHAQKWKRPPLSLTQLQQGKLSTEDKAFYKNVLDDLETGEARDTRGVILVRCPEKRPTLAKIWEEAEWIARRIPIHMIVIDHSLLIEGDKRERDPTERANRIFVDAKQMANQFAGGSGIGVLMTHQVNREGGKRAEQTGALRLVDLARANEAERSPDIVTATWADAGMRAAGQTRFLHLKHRRAGGRLVPPFLVDIHPDSNLMTRTTPLDVVDVPQRAAEIDDLLANV